MKIAINSPAVRIEETLLLPKVSRFRSACEDLLVHVYSDRPLSQITSLRMTGRISEATFPFKRVTVRHGTTLRHFRLMVPRLVEDARQGVLFEIQSQPRCFIYSPRTLAWLEFHRRLVTDHLWLRVVSRDHSSAVRQVEALSVAITALFTFMGICSLGFTFTLRKDQAVDVTRPFHFHSSDFVLGLWTALLVTPLMTIILEILNRCQHRSIITSSLPSVTDAAADNKNGQSTKPVRSFGSPLIRRLLAYVLCFTVSCQSVCLVLIFELMYTPPLSLRWLVSVGSAFVISFFLLELVKVMGKCLWLCYTRTETEYFSKRFFKCSHVILS